MELVQMEPSLLNLKDALRFKGYQTNSVKALMVGMLYMPCVGNHILCTIPRG